MTKRVRRAGVEDWPTLWGEAILDFLQLKHLPGWEGPVPTAGRLNYLSDEARQGREAMRREGLPVITEKQAVRTQQDQDAFMDDHVHFIRDIFGNPFRPIAFNSSWQTSTVRRLAQAAYDERRLPEGTLDATRLAVLANALEEAGCDSADLLAHLRGPGPHVRGCWAVDLALGKE